MALVKTINRNGEILTPHIADDVFMAENATVVGDVTVGEGSSLWFNSVLRGDVNTIVIGKHCKSRMAQYSTRSTRNRPSAWVTTSLSDITSLSTVPTSMTML